MDTEEFRKRGKEMIDYMADYMDNVHKQRVIPDVQPGYLRKLLPDSAPQEGESFDDIMNDVTEKIMPGITHWQHPNFHAYFPSGNSWPSILGDMLSDAIGCIGFSWASSPACTELEKVVMDWVGKLIGLPNKFLHEGGEGGGVIQGSASECVLVAMLAARHTTLQKLKENSPFVDEGVLLSKLVGYSSKMAHSCAEKAGMLGGVKMRQLEVDDKFALRGYTLEQAIQEDMRIGLIPFFVEATIGTTGCCSFDNIYEIGKVCENQNVWLHVDGAYAGNALICPEFQYLLKGIEHVSSFNFNPNKWMLVNFDCSLMWVADKIKLTDSMTVDPLYLQHKHEDRSVDFRHWGIPLSRRFRALKLWFVLRMYGVEGLQKYIRKHVELAKKFEAFVRNDRRFEVKGDVKLGLVCFRLKGPNTLTIKLLKMINNTGKLHMVPALLNEDYVIRFALCAENACEKDVRYAWRIISVATNELMKIRKSWRESLKSISEVEIPEVDDMHLTDEVIEEVIEEKEEEEDEEQEEEVFKDAFSDMINDQQRTRLQRSFSMKNQSSLYRRVSNARSYRQINREHKRLVRSKTVHWGDGDLPPGLLKENGEV